MKNNSSVPSVNSAMRILDFLSRYKTRESTLSEIANSLNINKSTCLRILRVLNEYQVVSYNESTKKYSLGVGLAVLGARAYEFCDELEISKKYLAQLKNETKLTSVLVKRRGDNRIFYMAKEEPTSNMDIKIHVVIGQHFPITVTSFGKCFMAYMDDDEFEQVIENIGFKKFTNKTITDKEKLQQELKDVQKNGYAVSYEEHTPNVIGIASPIFNYEGKVIMSIACLALPAYINQNRISTLGGMTKNIADKITDALGGIRI